ncbi:hypothetical protein ACFPRL_21445 [Pseudoclavibacter helvolus]
MAPPCTRPRIPSRSSAVRSDRTVTSDTPSSRLRSATLAKPVRLTSSTTSALRASAGRSGVVSLFTTLHSLRLRKQIRA